MVSAAEVAEDIYNSLERNTWSKYDISDNIITIKLENEQVFTVSVYELPKEAHLLKVGKN